jgi:hypothetical protein
MIKKLQSVIFLLSIGILASGCAVGNKYSYHDTVASIQASGSRTVSIATHDQREYIVSGRKNPDFIGLQRGGYGNPFNVSTESGMPLADDMTKTIAASLLAKGFKAVPLLVSHSENQAEILNRLKASSGEILILLTLNEWKSDTATNVALIYDVTLRVYDKAGNPVTEKSLKGKDDLKGSAWNPPAYAKEHVPKAFRQKIEELFNSPDIAKALQ